MPSVTLNVVDSSTDSALNIARNTYPDHIPANSVWAMVDGIIARLSLTRSTRDSDPVVIGLLRIVGHGEAGIQAIGDSRTTHNPRQIISIDCHGHLTNREKLLQLRGRFAANAIVELHGCQTGGGSGSSVVRQLEALWGVRVRASTINQDFSTPGMEVFAH